MNQMKSDIKNNLEFVINIREERLKTVTKPKKEENKSVVDEARDNAKKHFDEIFNRI